MWRLVDRLPKLTSEHVFCAALVLVHAVVTLIATQAHEPWRDEADTWLLARDASPLTILARTGYVGMPALWHLMLVPLAKSGLPYAAQGLLNWAIALSAAAVIVYASPFSRVTRTLLVSGYFMAYEYAVVARSYALSALLLFSIAALHRSRLQHPLRYAFLVGLLANTNPHSLAPAGLLCAELVASAVWRGEFRRRTLMAAALMSVLLAASVLQLMPPTDGDVVGFARFIALDALPRSLGSAMIPWFPELGFPLAAVALVTATYAIRRAPGALFFLWGSYIWLEYIFVFKYTGDVRHFGFLLFVLLTALWIAYRDGRVTVPKSYPRAWAWNLRVMWAVLNTALALSAIVGTLWLSRDMTGAYSGAQQTAQFITDSHLDSRLIVAYPAPHAEALLPYLPRVQFWLAGEERFGTYMLWDRNYRRGLDVSLEGALAQARRDLPDQTNMLLLLNQPLPERERPNFRVIYAPSRDIFAHVDETYYLYEPLS